MGFRVILSLALFKCIVVGAPVNDPSESAFPLNSSLVMNGHMRCDCSPTNHGYPREALDIMKKGVDNLKKAVLEVNIFDESEVGLLPRNVELAAQECFRKFGTEACINADEKLRESGTFYCMHETKTAKNVYPKNKQFVTVGLCHSNNKTKSTEAQLSDPVNEGCVAVEHLKGYYTLHRYDLKRRVLCVPELDFCATANHALLVDDKWTSLKKLCSKGGWECTEEERMVNNLNVLLRTRLRFNDRIVITPYDATWPIFMTVIGQIIELTWNLVLKIVNLILVLSILLVAHGVLATNGHFSLTGTTPLETVISKTPTGVQNFASGVFDSFSPTNGDDTGCDTFGTPSSAVGTGLLARSPRVVQNVCQLGMNMMERIYGNAEVRRIELPKTETTADSQTAEASDATEDAAPAAKSGQPVDEEKTEYTTLQELKEEVKKVEAVLENPEELEKVEKLLEKPAEAKKED